LTTGRLHIGRLAVLLVLSGAVLTQTVHSAPGESNAAEPVPQNDWAGYNKTLDGERFSPLKQISVDNAGTLRQACRVEVAHLGSFEAGPVVVGRTMYVTAEEQTVALDPVTCFIHWRHVYRRQQQPGTILANRGVAYLNGRVFRGTDDARIIALDAATGKEIWTSVAGDSRLGESIPGAPLAWNGLIFIGIAGGEWGIKGRILAYDAMTGREVWRFNTVASGKETGADTWKDNKWAEHGGGGSWSSFALDPSTEEIFVPVGNPAPDWAPQDRPGANLFTDSVVVLDARTGALKWWYQLVANDGHDWDLGAAPMLYRDTRNRDMVAAAGKDGYLHVVDRESHALAFRVPTTTVDENPLAPTATGNKVCPGAGGGTQWNGPAFDPILKTVFTGAIDMCMVLTTEPGKSYKGNAPAAESEYGAVRPFYGGTAQFPSQPGTGWISAFESDTGKLRWKYHTDSLVLAGITATAGGIVMTGDNAGNFLVLDSSSGSVLKKLATGGSIAGGIATYEIGGRQYVAFTSGNISRSAFFGAMGRPSVVILEADLPRQVIRSTSPDSRNGRDLYQQMCSVCHGQDGKGIEGYDLKTVKNRMDRVQLASWIRNPRPPMPKTFPEPLEGKDARDIADIAAYLEQ
jgi:alcohol dehydrogenase (cytochrome c)